MKTRITGIGKLVLAASAVVLLAASAFAAPNLSIAISVAKEETVTENGQKTVKRVPAKEGYPGDVLVYAIAYKNSGDSDAVSAQIVDPLPKGTVYVQGSGNTPDAELTFSIDGGKTYMAEPVTFTIADDKGVKVTKTATPDMYTHAKWKLLKPVAPNGEGTLEFKVKVK